MTKDKIEMISFRDISGRDHYFKKSSFKGHYNLFGRWFVYFNGSKIEICRCEVKRIFQDKNLIDNSLTTFVLPLGESINLKEDLTKKDKLLTELKSINELQALKIKELKDEIQKLKSKNLFQRIFNL